MLLFLFVFVFFSLRGVVLYTMVFGALPFGDKKKIKCGLVNYYDLPLKGRITAGNNMVAIIICKDVDRYY